jgi:hypothetical protein
LKKHSVYILQKRLSPEQREHEKAQLKEEKVIEKKIEKIKS